MNVKYFYCLIYFVSGFWIIFYSHWKLQNQKYFKQQVKTCTNTSFLKILHISKDYEKNKNKVKIIANFRFSVHLTIFSFILNVSRFDPFGTIISFCSFVVRLHVIYVFLSNLNGRKTEEKAIKIGEYFSIGPWSCYS